MYVEATGQNLEIRGNRIFRPPGSETFATPLTMGKTRKGDKVGETSKIGTNSTPGDVGNSVDGSSGKKGGGGKCKVLSFRI